MVKLKSKKTTMSKKITEVPSSNPKFELMNNPAFNIPTVTSDFDSEQKL